MDDEFEDGDDTEEIELGIGNSGQAWVKLKACDSFFGQFGNLKNLPLSLLSELLICSAPMRFATETS
jgi:hypothetical protein